MKKIIALLLACLMIVGMFAGCSGSKKIELLVWGPAEDIAEGAWLRQMCEKFDEAHDEWEIEFKFETCGEGDSGTMVTKDPTVAGDIYCLASDQIGSLVAANALSKLGGETAENVKKNNATSIVNSVTYNDSIYAVPYTNNTWMMFYNKSIFTEEDVKSLDTMLAKGKVSFPVTTGWYFSSFYVANGGELFGANGADAAAGITFGGENGTAVTEYLVNLVNNPNFVNDASGAGYDGLANGTVGAMFTGSWDAAKIQKALGENFGVTSLPTITINGEAKQLKSFAGSKGVGVNPNCKNPEVAVALANFLGSDEAQLAHYELRNVIPCSVALQANETIKADAVAVAEAATIANTSVVQPLIPEMGNYWGPAETMGNAIYNGEVTLDNAAAETEKFNNSLNNSGL